MKMVTLGEVASVDRRTLRPEQIPPETKYIGLEHIASHSRLAIPTTALDAEISSTKHLFNDSQILYGKLRPYLAKIATPDFSGVCSTDILPISAGPEIDRSYLYHFLSSERTVSEVASKATGANLPRIKPSAITELKIPLPPLTEQSRIAAILDKADAIRHKRYQTIAHLGALARSIFHDMFGSVRNTMTVAELAAPTARSIRTGPFGSQLLHEEFISSGRPVLGIDNVAENKFKWKQRRYISEAKFHELEKYEVFSGDVLVTIMGTTGRCAVVPEGIPRAINTKHLCAITPNRNLVLPKYLQTAFLNHPTTRRFLEDNTRGAIMAGLNMGIIKRTPIPVPSLAQQEAFIGRLNAIEAVKERFLMQHGDELFSSLQSRAFRGEL